MNEISRSVWEDRYRYGDEDCYEATLERVFGELEKTLKEIAPDGWKRGEELLQQAKQYALQRKFVPGGRILASVGTGTELTLYNCLTLPAPEDSIEGIVRTQWELMEAMRRGAGVGLRLSTLRPRGAEVKSVRGKASGPVSFGDLYDLAVGTIKQGGSRRGALLMAMNTSHPDIVRFIRRKINGGWENTNITVFVDGDWWELPAALRKEIAWAAWACGDPGVLFVKTAKKHYLGQRPAMSKSFPFEGVNACSEVLLPAYGCCLLGSINLNEVEMDEITNVARAGVFALWLCHTVALKNNMLPLPKCRPPILELGQVGLGIMGLAQFLIKKDAKYGSDHSLCIVDGIGERLFEGAKSACKDIDEWFCKADVPTLTTTLASVAAPPAAMLSCPPTGTTSLLVGASNGIEPLFAREIIRRDRLGEHRLDLVPEGYETSPAVVTAHEIHPIDRVRVQAALQKWLDNSISSTVNMPHDATPQQVEEVFSKAWEWGCVSITVFRDGCKPGVLEAVDKQQPARQPAPTAEKRSSDDVVETKRVVVPFGRGRMYVFVGLDKERQPIEAFAIERGGEPSMGALTYAMSKAMQAGADGIELSKKLLEFKGGQTAFVEGHVLQSKPAAVGWAILKAAGVLGAEGSADDEAVHCPRCGGALRRVGKCTQCTVCGESVCE